MATNQSLRETLERETAAQARPARAAPPTALDDALAGRDGTTRMTPEVRGPNRRTMQAVLAGMLSGDKRIKDASLLYYKSKVPKKQRQRYVPVSGGTLDTETGEIKRDEAWADKEQARALELARVKANARGEEWDRRYGIKQAVPQPLRSIDRQCLLVC